MSNDEYGFGGGAGYNQTTQSASVSFGDSNPEQSLTPASSAFSVKDISTAEFMTEVVEASTQLPVLVDFWAPWCGPCKQLAPALEKIVQEANGQIRLVKMNIDDHPEVAGQMGIQSIPAVVAFKDGKPADAFMGMKSESEIREFIEKIAGPIGVDPSEELLNQAKTLVEEGATEEAIQIYNGILQSQPQHLAALSGLGHLYIMDNDHEAASVLLASLSEDQLDSEDIKSLKSAIELAEQAADLGNFDELVKAVEDNPQDPQHRLDLSIAYNGANMREEAADQLLEIITRKPGWNEDAARTQLLQFFEAWGMMDEATISARRRLSSILFS